MTNLARPNDTELPDPETAHTMTLIREAQGGEHPALEQLFERYYPALRRMVSPMLGPGLRRCMESGDVLGEALYDAIRDFDRFDIQSRGRFMALMRQIVENRIRKEVRFQKADKRDKHREQALRRITDSVKSGSLCLDPQSPEPSPSAVVGQGEQVAVIESFIRTLPERTQQVMRLRHGGDYSWASIAREVGFESEDAARMHYVRAQSQLRKLMRDRMGQSAVQ